MVYRIQVFLGEQKLVDLASDKPLADTREDAVDAVNLFHGEYVLIVDEAGQLIDRMKRSA